MREIFRQLIDLAAVGQVGGYSVDLDIGISCNRLFGSGQIGGGARHQNDIASFSHQIFGRGAADALGGAGNQRGLTR